MTNIIDTFDAINTRLTATHIIEHSYGTSTLRIERVSETRWYGRAGSIDFDAKFEDDTMLVRESDTGRFLPIDNSRYAGEVGAECGGFWTRVEDLIRSTDEATLQAYREMADLYEDETGLTFNEDDGSVALCECGKFYQSSDEHYCYYMAGEDNTARMLG